MSFVNHGPLTGITLALPQGKCKDTETLRIFNESPCLWDVIARHEAIFSKLTCSCLHEIASPTARNTPRDVRPGQVCTGRTPVLA